MADTFVKIASVAVGAGGVASVTFNSIPQTYTDLVVKTSARSTKSGNLDDNFSLQPNGSGSNFSWRWVYTNGSSALSANGTNPYGAIYGTAAAATANTFGNSEAYITNYTGSTFKSMSIDNANENNATANIINLVAFLWSDTAPITSLTIDAGGGDIVQYSTFTLYGILKA